VLLLQGDTRKRDKREEYIFHHPRNCHSREPLLRVYSGEREKDKKKKIARKGKKWRLKITRIRGSVVFSLLWKAAILVMRRVKSVKVSSPKYFREHCRCAYHRMAPPRTRLLKISNNTTAKRVISNRKEYSTEVPKQGSVKHYLRLC
jgi:hypothetical protein